MLQIEWAGKEDGRRGTSWKKAWGKEALAGADVGGRVGTYGYEILGHMRLCMEKLDLYWGREREMSREMEIKEDKASGNF